MLAVSAALGMAPFGDNTILISDMSTQYVEFFCALKNGDLFFSWSKALGTAYVGVFSYYVSSPLSLLTLLVPNEAMPVGLLFLAVLKIALAGLAFCLFIRRRYPLGTGRRCSPRCATPSCPTTPCTPSASCGWTG